MLEKYIYFVRHAMSKSNVDVTFGGDEHIVDAGRDDAYILRDKLTDMDFTLAISSDRKRAIETSLLVFASRNTFIVDRRFREIYFGRLEGKPITDEVVAEIQENPYIIKHKYYGDDIFERVSEVLKALYTYIDVFGGDIVIVTHDTLLELLFWMTNFYQLNDRSQFKLWDNKYIMKYCDMIKVPVSFINSFRGKELKK